ncbi:MAG: RNase adapter RapZ [Myxococcales bacterium]|nr:RNase adapter RapZ [Myxococcales bacterium]
MTGLQVVVVTGLSGAGRSTALRVLEDMGFFCVDNLPPALAPALVELVASPGASRPPAPPPADEGASAAREHEGATIDRVGLGIDVRTGSFLDGAGDVLDALERSGHDVEVLFLDCADEVLVRRFSETRRPHALSVAGDLTGAIARERERLGFLRARARHVIDTTTLSVHDLRRALVDHLGRQRPPGMVTRVVSFGFKYGLPVDADLVFDVRYLPNPHFVPELRPKTGLDPAVARYVLGADDTQDLLARLEPMLRDLLPRYEREGKAYLTVAIGCTGGRHRSVAIAEELGRRLGADRLVAVAHRDAQRGP